jgi:hypothetical protein
MTHVSRRGDGSQRVVRIADGAFAGTMQHADLDPDSWSVMHRVFIKIVGDKVTIDNDGFKCCDSSITFNLPEAWNENADFEAPIQVQRSHGDTAMMQLFVKGMDQITIKSPNDPLFELRFHVDR